MHKKIVVLGGGISGLTSAFYLSSKFQDVTLVVGPRLGGWLKSIPKKHESYKITMESGPRSLRPFGVAGHLTLDLISKLNLENKVITVSRDSMAHKNRFIYYNNALHNIPTSFWKILRSRSPLVRGLLRGIIMEPFQPRSTCGDESISSFVSRRLGPFISDNLISAMVRGIYAGDSTKLSIDATFGSLKELERKYGSLIFGTLFSILKKQTKFQSSNEKSQAFIDRISKFRIYTLQDGLETLAKKIHEVLLERNVNVIAESCSGIISAQNQIEIRLDNSSIFADFVVNTIPAYCFSRIISELNDSIRLKNLLETITTVDVAVINLLFRGNHIETPGFGFLVPTTESKNCDVFGVVYDSCTFPQHIENSETTNLTVMIGGTAIKRNPTTDSLKEIALSTVSRILKIPKEALVKHHVEIHRNCIPQYPVNHKNNVEMIEKHISDIFRGKLILAGASYYGVSVNDCVYSGFTAAHKFIDQI